MQTLKIFFHNVRQAARPYSSSVYVRRLVAQRFEIPVRNNPWFMRIDLFMRRQDGTPFNPHLEEKNYDAQMDLIALDDRRASTRVLLRWAKYIVSEGVGLGLIMGSLIIYPPALVYLQLIFLLGNIYVLLKARHMIARFISDPNRMGLIWKAVKVSFSKPYYELCFVIKSFCYVPLAEQDIPAIRRHQADVDAHGQPEEVHDDT